jgi:hypothetical protein
MYYVKVWLEIFENQQHWEQKQSNKSLFIDIFCIYCWYMQSIDIYFAYIFIYVQLVDDSAGKCISTYKSNYNLGEILQDTATYLLACTT